MKAAYFDCLSGVSGNMLLGAFLDAGARLETLTATLDALGLADSAEVVASQTMKGNRRATHVEIEVKQPKPWRHVGEIDRLIAGSTLDEGVKERSRLAFRLLAQAEATAHGVEPESVRLHEAGAVDAVIDVCGTFSLARALGVETFYCSALPLSEGHTEAAHGTIPLPAPATMNILRAVGAPTYTKDGGAELVTPTGAAIIGACAHFASPPMEPELEGYGAGTADLDWPNVLRLVVGEVDEAAAAAGQPDRTGALATPVVAQAAAPLLDPSGGLEEDTVTVLETNIDDMPPNLLAGVIGAALEQGALDAFITPVLMKKGRPGHLLTVLCRVEDGPRLAEMLIRDTATFGVRLREQRRIMAGRRPERLQSSLGEVGIKLKLMRGQVVAAMPEHDDVVARAAERGISPAEAHQVVAEEARQAFVVPAARTSPGEAPAGPRGKRRSRRS